MEETEIVFNGVTYRRYPQAKRWVDRVYFRAVPADRARGFSRLHVDMWEDAHGEVPDGCHIHHKDGNPLNNVIGNLECLTPVQHVGEHRGNPVRRSPEWLAKLDEARALSGDSLKSPEFRDGAKQRCEQQWKSREATQRQCEHCGRGFESRCVRTVRFCSGACDSAWRAANKAYHEERCCGYCGKLFSVDKWKTTQCCSRSCAQRLLNQLRTKK